MLKLYNILIFLIFCGCVNAENENIICGADQPEKYLKELDGCSVGLVVNQTSLVKNEHLVDFLISREVNVEKIFAPEHGFRGDVAAGITVNDSIDFETGVSVVSLYGANKKLLASDLKDVDVVVFDIQDVGCRFYTYLSTLHYVMEACAENEKKLILLDRPNPNGDYVGGPVLSEEYKSFVGMHPIPVVHGCTLGEMAGMINGENWLNDGVKCDFEVICIANYNHSKHYSLPIKPSPNLPNDVAIRLYPSLCLFEGTYVSIGRGTQWPFQVIGYPDSSLGKFQFTPVEIPGVARNPVNEGEKCFGNDLQKLDTIPPFTMKYFIEWFHKVDKIKDEGFIKSNRWIKLLAGEDSIVERIEQGFTDRDFKEEWLVDLNEYKKIRKKYLLYDDFE